MSAALIARGAKRWLVDCGEGTQRQLMRSGMGLVDVDMVLLTHLHADHFLGLPGLLKTYGLRGRERPLTVVGPTGLGRLMADLAPVIGRVPFRVVIDERNPIRPGVVAEVDGAGLEYFPTRHSVPSMGFVVIEDDRPGAFDARRARELGVEEGPQFGVLQRGGEVVLPSGAVVRSHQVVGPPRLGRMLAITGDTEPCGSTIDASAGASLLIHEATFLDEDRDRARATMHSTAREAAVTAREAGVDLLVLTHLSARYQPGRVADEAREVFPETVAGRDFDRIEIPFPERGPAVVHTSRADRRGAAPSALAGTVDQPDL